MSVKTFSVPKSVIDNHVKWANEHELHSIDESGFLGKLLGCLPFLRALFGYSVYSLNDQTYYVKTDRIYTVLDVSKNIEMNGRNVQALVELFFSLGGKKLSFSDNLLTQLPLFEKAYEKICVRVKSLKSEEDSFKVRLITSRDPDAILKDYLEGDDLFNSLGPIVTPFNLIPTICQELLQPKQPEAPFLSQSPKSLSSRSPSLIPPDSSRSTSHASPTSPSSSSSDASWRDLRWLLASSAFDN